MKLDRFCKPSFAVIGKEGSTRDGEGFIRRLWEDANAHFDEVASLARRNADGSLAGVWGAMSDFSRSFAPWENFSSGLYLAGVECDADAEPPEGWVKWILPGYEYARVPNDGPDAFAEGLRQLRENGLALAGAAHDFTCPQTGKEYVLFPILALESDDPRGK